ncbi:unnamed protein product [Ophioblennius macclurei]
MHRGLFPLVLVFHSFLWALTRGDIRISCDLGETCVLPCSFKSSDEEVIHWTQEEPVKVAAHSYYYDKDQLGLQDKRFQGRTSLFLDQLSMRNASLQLRKVEIEDEGNYRCYISTKAGQEQSFIRLEVNAPVLKVSVVRTGDRTLICISEGIYPEPKLTWSTMPPSDVSLQSNPTVAQSKEKLYSISCLLTLTSNNLNPSCTVETRRNKKTMTLMERIHQHSYDETILTCPLPAAPLVTVIWRFGQSQEILRQDSNKDLLVSDKWKKHFDELSVSGDLILKELTPKEKGLYTCDASNSEETLRSETFLNIDERPEPSRDKSGTIAGVLCGVTAGLLLISIMVFCLRRRQTIS